MDRIQFRRDTLDNWNRVNPILLEGEIGYVLDDPNRYKMGDGVKTWDQLPFRGFDGTIVHDTGDSENAVMSQKATSKAVHEILYDVSAHNDGAVFESLQALLSSSNLSTLIPTSVRHGGMSIRFIQSSDNKYVQYRLMSDTFNNTVTNWQGVDDIPILASLSISSEITNLFQKGFWYNGAFIDYDTDAHFDWMISCKQKFPLSDVAIYFDTEISDEKIIRLVIQAWDDSDNELDPVAASINQHNGYFITTGLKEQILAKYPSATKMTVSFSLYNSAITTHFQITNYRIFNIDKSIPSYIRQDIDGMELSSSTYFSNGFWYLGVLNDSIWPNNKSLTTPIELVDDFCVRIDGINFEGLCMSMQIFDEYGKELTYEFWQNPIYIESGYGEFFGFKNKVLEKYPTAKKFTVSIFKIDNTSFDNTFISFDNTFTLFTNKKAWLHREYTVDFQTNKRISLYGDSITNEYPEYGTIYQTFISRKVRAKNVIKNGYDGASCTQGIIYGGKPWDNYLSDNTRLQDLIADSPDVIFMLVGTNDYQVGAEIGNIDDVGVTTFYGALRHIIETVMGELPNCVIIMCTPTPFYYGPGSSSKHSGRVPNNKGYILRDYADAIIKISSQYNIPVCDISGKAGWLDINEVTLNFTTDGVHISKKGYDRITSIQAGTYKSLFSI